MPDTTIKKVEAGSSPQGEMGQKYLVAGKRVSMRLWVEEPGGNSRRPRRGITKLWAMSSRAAQDLIWKDRL